MACGQGRGGPRRRPGREAATAPGQGSRDGGRKKNPNLNLLYTMLLTSELIDDYPVPKDYYIHIDSGPGLMGLNNKK
jgi:hypothetical protein